MIKKIILVVMLLIVASCGNKKKTPTINRDDTVAPSFLVGEYKEANQVSVHSSAEIVSVLSDQSTVDLQISPIYNVTSYKLTYTTTDGFGKEIVASGLVSVPNKPEGSTSPLMAYQHGTILKNSEAPSNHAVADEPAIVLASLGYIVMAADYVGYGVTQGAEHPYMLTEPSAVAVIDFIVASKKWLVNNRINFNDQLFLTGYSEGGYVTMATHKVLQKSDNLLSSNIVATACGAGPYNYTIVLDKLMTDVAEKNPPLKIVTGKDFLSSLTDSMREKIRDLLYKQLLPDNTDVIFQKTFIDTYLADDQALIALQSDVHDWSPNKKVYMFHGRDDEIVPYSSSATTVQAIQAQNNQNISLTDCDNVPSTHQQCIRPFWYFLVNTFKPLAHDL